VSEHDELHRYRAEVIARAAHAGQVDKAGADYIRHVERVVAQVASDEAKAVAWLHDVLEDTEWDRAMLAAAQVPERILDAVQLLTRTDVEPGERLTYGDYIDRIWQSGNLLAVEVKVADLKDHFDANLSPKLRTRYERALMVLEPALVVLRADRDELLG
jgi:hypothetical protein